MLVLISYDVVVTSPGGQRRLRRVAKTCLDYGQRVQFSVFECLVEPAQWVKLKAKLESIIDPKLDSLRYYLLGTHWEHKVEHVGAKPSLDLEGPMIV